MMACALTPSMSLKTWFLHELDLLAGLGDEVAAVAQEVAQGEDFLLRPEAAAQQTGGVELLEPGGVAHVGLFAGDAFDVAGVDQADFDPGIFERGAGAEPVVAGAFHGDGFDVAGQEPGAQGVQTLGEGAEGAPGRPFAAPGRDGGDEFLRAHIDAGGVGMVGEVERSLGGGEFLAFVDSAFALAHDFWFPGERMTGQPPNTMSQSPERGQCRPWPGGTATNGRLAGAAAMLTHGVTSASLHHWRSGLLPRHARGHGSTPRTFAHTNPSYSLAVKDRVCSGANHARQRTRPSRSGCNPCVPRAGSLSLGR